MQRKTIKQVLIKKINNFLESIDDNVVKGVIKKDIIISGGCFTSMLQNESPKDFDCYFRTKSTTLLVANYFAKKWNENHVDQIMVLDGENPSEEILNYYNIKKISDCSPRMIANTTPDRIKMIFPSQGIVGDTDAINSNEELGIDTKQTMSEIEMITELDDTSANEIIKNEKKEYFPVFISTNAITLSNGIQLVVRFYGEPDKIHETYDFEHTKAYFDYDNDDLSISVEVYECVMNKVLRYTGSKYPVCSIFRVRKFLERGWTINAGQLLKMCIQISELNLMNIDVLEDQLIGVDSLYFMNLIEQFRKMKEQDVNFEITPNYIISIIDKIF